MTRNIATKSFVLTNGIEEYILRKLVFENLRTFSLVCVVKFTT